MFQGQIASNFSSNFQSLETMSSQDGGKLKN